MENNNLENECISVEIVYGSAAEQIKIPLVMPRNSFLKKALEYANINEILPKFNWAEAKLGIYGRVVDCNYILKNNDRIEIYRPLIMDPKEARRFRAEKSNRSKK